MKPIEFDAIIFQEGQAYVTHCPELDVSSCGKDIDEARRNLKTAVRLFIEEAEKLGTLGAARPVVIPTGTKCRCSSSRITCAPQVFRVRSTLCF